MAKPLGSTGEFFRRRDERRRHPMLTNNFRHATPGLGIALVAFGIYLAGEAAYNHFRRLTPRPPPITDCWCTIACVVRTPLLPKMKKACKKILSMSTKPATIENRKFLDNYYDLGTMRRRDI